MGVIDDDIEISVSGLNRLLAIAAAEKLDSFAPALSADSHYSHKQFVYRSSADWHEVPWVEVMMPFYRYGLFMAARPYFKLSISSYGIDQFVMTMMQRLLGMGRVAVVDAVVAKHSRAITSHRRIFSNGLSAAQERYRLRAHCMAEIAKVHPDLLGTSWYYRTFAPLNGPIRFWTAYLLWPVHKLKRVITASFS